MTDRKLGFSTLQIHGGQEPDSATGSRAVPIYQTTSYCFDSVQYGADLFALKEEGHIYSRISNPTVQVFEDRMALLEGGVGAVAFSSGMGAINAAILNIMKAGDEIVAAPTLYGGTYNLLSNMLPKFGIKVHFVNPDDPESFRAAINENTRLVYAETIGNPGLNILDFDKFSKVAKKLDVPFIVDNTVATPIHCNPLKLGANIVIHSTSKYSDGHAQALGGIIVDGGNFNWDNGKFNEFVDPDPSYHGLSYVKTFKEAAYITKLRVTLIRDLGGIQTPFNAYLTNLGLETLELRMERHSKNALEIAKWLINHPKITWVNYPYLEGSSEYEKAQKYLNGGASGILTFGVKGGIPAAKTLMKELKLVALVVHLGDARTSLLHPATTTHNQLNEEEQRIAGVAPDLIRFSVGIERVEDIIADLDRALEKIEI